MSLAMGSPPVCPAFLTQETKIKKSARRSTAPKGLKQVDHWQFKNIELQAGGESIILRAYLPSDFVQQFQQGARTNALARGASQDHN